MAKPPPSVFVDLSPEFRAFNAVNLRLGHPPLKVNTLAQFGVMCRVQGRHDEAVAWLGQALEIASEYQMPVGSQILANLALLLQVMGEPVYTQAWRAAFNGQDPPLAAIRSR